MPYMGFWFSVLPLITYLGELRELKRFARVNLIPFESPNSKYDKEPCNLIRKHFNLPRKKMYITTYFHYIYLYINFIYAIIAPAVGLLTGFNVTITGLLFCFWIILFEVYLFNSCLIRCFFVPWKKQKPKVKKPKKSISQIIAEEKEIAEGMFYIPNKWEVPLTKKLKKYLKRYKGKEYLPASYVKYIEEKFLILHKKHVYYEIQTDANGKSSLLVYAKKEKRLIFQAPIKKL